MNVDVAGSGFFKRSFRFTCFILSMINGNCLFLRIRLKHSALWQNRLDGAKIDSIFNLYKPRDVNKFGSSNEMGLSSFLFYSFLSCF